MLRLRIFACAISFLTLLLAVWAWIGASAAGVALLAIGAAGALAIVCPFDAATPWQRTRVTALCIVYVAAVAAALLLSVRTGAPRGVTIPLVLLVELGLGLACWAVATRKRRRMPASRRYFDN